MTITEILEKTILESYLTSDYKVVSFTDGSKTQTFVVIKGLPLPKYIFTSIMVDHIFNTPKVTEYYDKIRKAYTRISKFVSLPNDMPSYPRSYEQTQIPKLLIEFWAERFPDGSGFPSLLKFVEEYEDACSEKPIPVQKLLDI